MTDSDNDSSGDDEAPMTLPGGQFPRSQRIGINYPKRVIPHFNCMEAISVWLRGFPSTLEHRFGIYYRVSI